MAIESGYTTVVRTRACELLETSKRVQYGTDDIDKSIVSIELGKAGVNALTRLCEKVDGLYGKVDDPAKQEIMAILKKAEKKFAFAERVMEYKVRGHTVMSDPRIEKMVGKLTQFKENPLPQKTEELADMNIKLLKWRANLAEIVKVDRTRSELTTRARSLIEEIHPQVRRAFWGIEN